MIKYLVMGLTLLPAVAGARSVVDSNSTCAQTGDCDFNDLGHIIDTTAEYAMLFTVTAAVAMFIFAGFLYVTAQGNTAQIKRATRIFRNVLIGFVIILGAVLLVKEMLVQIINPSEFKVEKCNRRYTMIKTINNLKIFFLLIVSFIPLSTEARSVNFHFKNPTRFNSVQELLAEFLAWIVNLGTVAVVLAFVYVGYQFVAAKGNPDAIKTAKISFMWTVIGTLVLLGAFVLREVITNTITTVTS
jgi:threonine/homoserine/homoserine lactone efflux protein